MATIVATTSVDMSVSLRNAVPVSVSRSLLPTRRGCGHPNGARNGRNRPAGANLDTAGVLIRAVKKALVRYRDNTSSDKRTGHWKRKDATAAPHPTP